MSNDDGRGFGIMGQYDFSYEIPDTFSKRVVQYLKQSGGKLLSDTFQRCKYEHTVLQYAYYEGMKGDNWNKKAVDFTIEGTAKDISILKANNQKLINAIGMALKPDESGFLVKTVFYFEEDEIQSNISIPVSNEERLEFDINSANKVLTDLITIGERICTNRSYSSSTLEDTINDAFRDMLFTKGYNEVKDQTRHGPSSTGKRSGNVDLLLTKDGKEIAIFEAMKLSSFSRGYIDEHINKALINYNALGTPTFIVVYYNSPNFGDFWIKYYEYIKTYPYQCQVKKQIEELTHPNASTRVATTILSKDDFDFPVYFMAFKIV